MYRGVNKVTIRWVAFRREQPIVKGREEDITETGIYVWGATLCFRIRVNGASMQSTLCGICRDVAELFEGGFEIVDDFQGKNVGIGKIVGFYEAFVSEPKDVEAGIIRLMRSS